MAMPSSSLPEPTRPAIPRISPSWRSRLASLDGPVQRGEVAHREDDLALRDLSLPVEVLHGATHHLGHEIGFGDSGKVERRHELPVPQDRRAGRALEDLPQAMRDEDHGHPLGAQLLELGHEPRRGHLGERACGLVQDEDRGVRGYRPRDLDLLLQLHGEVTHDGVLVDLRSGLVQGLARLTTHLAPNRCRTCLAGAAP